MPEIKGDYQGKLKTIKATADAKLETVSAIEAGSAIIGNIDRVATVGQIDHLGTVEYVKEIDNLGTVGRLETLGMIEAGTISEVVHVGTIGDITHLGSIGNVNQIESLGTIGDINHLGSIGNTSFDQGAVSDHERHMHIKQYGTWQSLQGTENSAYVVPLTQRSGNLFSFRSAFGGELMTAPGYNGSSYTALRVDSGGRLKTAPATTRKGGKKVVTNQGTAVALVASSTPCISVIVKALHTNAGEIYVGDNTVGSATGYLLQKDEFISFSCDNVNGVYIDRNAGTQGVSFLYVNY